MERPFDTILRQAYGSLEKTEKKFIFNFNQNDKILVWIVGFSITAITLIVSKIADLNKTYDNGILKNRFVITYYHCDKWNTISDFCSFVYDKISKQNVFSGRRLFERENYANRNN